MRCGLRPASATTMAAWIARVQQAQLELLGNDKDAENEDFRSLSNQTSAETPLSVYQSIYAVLQDDHTGLFPLALAMLRPKLTKTEQQKLKDGLKLGRSRSRDERGGGSNRTD